ncbi:Uncharacterized protein Fot_32212 [Forsythia ovata]|uniref:Uncharacterized protein n=1 Tax=Forsythia ovata TaxID=205694 RepID=A0ABD1T7L1_9LAMI
MGCAEIECKDNIVDQTMFGGERIEYIVDLESLIEVGIERKLSQTALINPFFPDEKLSLKSLSHPSILPFSLPHPCSLRENQPQTALISPFFLMKNRTQIVTFETFGGPNGLKSDQFKVD